MDLRIRKIERCDYHAVASLVMNELGYGELDPDGIHLRMESMEEDPQHMTCVAELEGRIVGFIGLRKAVTFQADGERLHIIALAVSADRQGQGIGTALL